MSYNNIVFVDAHTLPDLWFQVQQKLWTEDVNEYVVGHGSYIGLKRREFDFFVGRVRHPEIRPLCEIDNAAGIHLPTSIEQVEKYFYNYIINTEVPPDTFYTYGERLMPQVLEVIRRYKTWGFRHAKASVSISKPEDILTVRNADDPDSRASEACFRELTFKTKFYPDENLWRLHMNIYFRVWDSFGGLPENLAALQMLNEMVVNEIGNDPETGYKLKTGEMIIVSPSLNIREHMFENSRKLVGLE